MVVVSRHEVVEGHLASECWFLYESSFGVLVTRSPCRQSYTREEFFAAMSTPHVQKFIAECEGRLVGLGIKTNDLRHVSWINPEYFEAKYPEQYAKGAGYMQGVATTEGVHVQAAIALVRACISDVPPGGLCLFDFSTTCNPLMPRLAERASRGLVEGPPRELDTQSYWMMQRCEE